MLFVGGLFVKFKLFRASLVIQAVMRSWWRHKELRTCECWVKELELHILSVSQVAKEACSSFLSLNEIEQASLYSVDKVVWPSA